MRGILQPLQPVVDFPLDKFQLLNFLMNQLFLLCQFVLHDLGISVLQKIPDLGQRNIQHPQVTDGVEHFHLPDTIIAVARPLINDLRRQKAAALVMPPGSISASAVISAPAASRASRFCTIRSRSCSCACRGRTLRPNTSRRRCCPWALPTPRGRFSPSSSA